MHACTYSQRSPSLSLAFRRDPIRAPTRYCYYYRMCVTIAPVRVPRLPPCVLHVLLITHDCRHMQTECCKNVPDILQESEYRYIRLHLQKTHTTFHDNRCCHWRVCNDLHDSTSSHCSIATRRMSCIFVGILVLLVLGTGYKRRHTHTHSRTHSHRVDARVRSWLDE